MLLLVRKQLFETIAQVGQAMGKIVIEPFGHFD